MQDSSQHAARTAHANSQLDWGQSMSLLRHGLSAALLFAPTVPAEPPPAIPGANAAIARAEVSAEVLHQHSVAEWRRCCG
jgi:hypothetical protein